MSHPPRIPVWLRWEQSNDATFSALKKAAAKLDEWTVLAAILMPDHLHAIVSPKQNREAKVGNLSGALKRWIRKEIHASWKWQPGCFDRLLRSDESLHQKWLYLEENPVRAGLVKNSKDWPYRFGFDDDQL